MKRNMQGQVGERNESSVDDVLMMSDENGEEWRCFGEQAGGGCAR